MKKDLIELEATPLRYFSPGDEEAFFLWLRTIPCVLSFKGQGTSLFIDVDIQKLDEENLTELIAFFHRYKMNMGSFRDERILKGHEWLNDPKGFWYKALFKATTQG